MNTEQSVIKKELDALHTLVNQFHPDGMRFIEQITENHRHEISIDMPEALFRWMKYLDSKYNDKNQMMQIVRSCMKELLTQNSRKLT